MARTPYEHTDGQAGTVSGDIAQTIQADGQDTITLPGADFVKNAELQRDGQDLILEGPDGVVIIIKDYFNAEPAPQLQADTGETLTPDLVNSFVKQSGPAEYAATGTANDASPVGVVHEAIGKATVTRTDGTTEEIRIGTKIFEGDIIETSGEGAVNVTFVDGSTFAVSQNAKLAIDEYVFDPASESGTSDFSILRGLFVFTSGLIGRDDPDDVEIDTPMGTIGIRGTIIAGNIDTGEITVLEGAIVLRAFNGHEVTLAQQYETARFDPAGGDVMYIGTIAPATFDSNFSAVKTVTPNLFTGLDATSSLQPENETSGEADNGVQLQETAPEPAPQQEPASEPAPMEESKLAPAPTSDPFFEKPAGTEFSETSETSISTLQPTTTASSGTTTTVTTSPTASSTQISEPVLVETTVSPLPPPSGTTTTSPPPPVHHIFLGDIIAAGTTVHGRFIAGSGGQKLGDYVAAVGDYDDNGSPDFFVGENEATGGRMFIYNGAGSSLAAINPAGTISSNMTAAGLGDLDGDGQADYIVGSPDDGGGFNGNAQIFVSGLGIVNFTGQDTNSTGLTNTDGGDFFGESVAGIGDINGDGFNDVMIGAPGRDSAATDDSGAAFVLLGGTAMPTSVDLDSWGYTLTSSASGDHYGDEVSGAGDLDNDGFTDFMVSRPGAGTVDIFFGDVTQANTTGSVKTITGINVDPAELDIPIMHMGDMNGDGISDIAVASTNGAGSVHIFSGATIAAAPATIGLASAMRTITPGATGFEIIGGGAAGDFNGDGFDDGVVAFQNGTNVEIFVVYGHQSSGTTGMGLMMTDPSTAFRMSIDISNFNVSSPGDFSVQVTNPGDLNGDGFDDVVLGMGDLNNGDGGVFIIDGRNDNAMGADGNLVHIAGQTTALNHVIAAANAEHLVGNAGANILDQAGRLDVSFRAGAGDDLIRMDHTDFRTIEGGAGMDRLELHTGTNLDFSNVGSEALSGIEEIAMMGTGQTLTLGIDDIFRLLQQSEDGTLRISANGDTSNRLVIDSNGNTLMAPGATSGTGLATELQDVHGSTPVTRSFSGGCDVFSFGGYTLAIESVLLDGTNPAQIV